MPDVNEESSEQALKKFDIIMRYLASENTMYWSRCQPLLIAQASILGFFGNQIKDVPADLSNYPWFKLNMLLVESLVALCLCGVWYFAIKSGQFWIDHWRRILVDNFEEKAFAGLSLYQNPIGRPRVRTRQIMVLLLGLFTVSWFLALSFVSYLELHKGSLIHF